MKHFKPTDLIPALGKLFGGESTPQVSEDESAIRAEHTERAHQIQIRYIRGELSYATMQAELEKLEQESSARLAARR
jgi:hypothetical protein